ncbi:hypothetical protein ACJMK2_016232, partial [Sinanodonta woodiana]
MAEQDELLSVKEKLNFISVHQSLGAVAKSFHQYVDKELKELHHKISSLCIAFEICQQQCSNTRTGTVGWCPTCTEWKKHLSQSLRHRRMKVLWDKMHSWEWPHNHLEIGKVYCPPNICQNWQTQTVNDLPMYLGILERCSIFPSSGSFSEKIRKMRDVRNNIAHKQSQRLSDIERDQRFKILEDFISADEIAMKVNSQSLLQELQDIKDNKEFDSTRNILPLIQNIEQHTHSWIRNIESRVQNIEKQTESLKQTKELLNQHSENKTEEQLTDFRTPDMRSKVGIASSVNPNRKYKWSIMLLLFINLTVFFEKSGIESDMGCLSEEYVHPLRPELYMSHYIHEHKELVGRQWLLQTISEAIFKEDFYHTGVLLVADMGFGKSAVVSHIVCAESNQPGALLRTKLLAYHICRFDALITKRADLFIRRLAGMIANSIPEFGSALETEYGVLSYLNSTKCNYDPVGCMDQSIVYPLSKLEMNNGIRQRMIIMIDGLDECEDTENAKNEILSVLERTADRFPAWIKFICTTRNIPSIVSKMGDFHAIQASANDSRNGKDIYDFVDKYLEENQITVQKLIKGWIFDKKMDVIKKLVDMSAGNFLYVHHALKYLKVKDILSMGNIPNSLNKIYQLNFERIYGTTYDRFQWAEKILEILSASKSPLKKEQIFKIINVEYKNLSRNMYDVEMHSLMHFVKATEDEYVCFSHISIYHWLTDIKKTGTLFYIDKEKGHNSIARYLFSILKKENSNSSAHIIDLAVHVSESKREDLITNFKSLPPKLFNSKSHSTSLLHKLASEVNSHFATELCLHFVKEFDSRNEDDITPAFIASGKGNEGTLQALLDAGADISFRRELPTLSGSLEDAVLITKTRTFWGYGLLDIAAQHGHVDTAQLLLTRNKSLAYVMNEMNIKPHHLACEFGHIKVLDVFLKLDPHLADQRCLYNAAFNGHQAIVQKLLYLDVKDLCVPCNGSMYWVSENENRMQAENVTVDFPKDPFGEITFAPKRKPFDDWWTISCETALHAASRLGFTDIVQLLTDQKQNAVSCRDRAGRTPFLSSIVYNRTEAISIIYPSANLSEKCLERDFSDDETMQLSRLEIQKLSEGKCPNGLSVVHLISRYGLDNLARSTLFHGLNWEEQDNEGNRPIHHAACYSGIEMIKILSNVLYVDLFSRTPNGSTAFHLAALCRPFNLVWLRDKTTGRLPQLYDALNRSILQYMYISPLPSVSVDGIQRDADRTALMKHLFSTEDISHVDNNNTNILHYVIGNGYFVSMINIYLNYQDEFKRLIMSNNTDNKIPLDEAFYNLPSISFMIKMPFNSLTVEMLLKTLRNFSDIHYFTNISPIEQSILYFVRIISEHTEYYSFFGKYVHNAIQKSYVDLTRTFLLYLKARDVLDYRGYSPLDTFMSIGNNPYMAELFFSNYSDIIKCGLPLEKSPLHKISLNINNSFWFVDSAKMQELLKGLTPGYLDQCYDAAGYNVFHRAAEGGNYELVKFFIDQDLIFTDNKKSISDYIMLVAMATFSFYKPVLQHYDLRMFNGSKQWIHVTKNIDMKNNYDLTLLLLLRKFKERGYLTYNHVCNTSSATLSLVHLAAANGLKQSLEYMSKKW